jgi:hypothetical protein
MLLAGLVVVAFGISRPTFAQQAGQKTFSSPTTAAAALAAAAQKQDKQEMVTILGHSGEQLIYIRRPGCRQDKQRSLRREVS